MGAAARAGTEPPLFTLLVLRQFLRADYRGVVTLVGEWSELRQVLSLAKVPHCSTLAYASRRILADGHEKGLSMSSRQAWETEPAPTA